MSKVDVAICVYGKPYTTAVTVASLIKHSGKHIGRVFIQEDPAQPYNETVHYLPRCFPELNIVQHVPEVFIGNAFPDFERLLANDASYRLSIRYQYAWENTQEDLLFIAHNDCLFSADVIGQMREAMGSEFVGAGMIGQCWNCPAYYAQLCEGAVHESFKPSYEEAIAVVRAFPGPRTFPESISEEFPTPFPECRLNEFACLVNVSATREHVYPLGPILPFGALTLDTGSDWFMHLSRRGYRFLDYREGFAHAPFSDTRSGDRANYQRWAYDAQEDRARTYLREHHPRVFDRLDVLRTITRTLKGLV